MYINLKKQILLIMLKALKHSQFEELNNLYIESSISQFDNREILKHIQLKNVISAKIASGSEF